MSDDTREEELRAVARLLFLLEERSLHDQYRQNLPPVITPAIRKAMDRVAAAYAHNNPSPPRTPEEGGEARKEPEKPVSRFKWLETD